MIGWFDGSAGVSGDMLLGALVDAGAPLEALQGALDAVGVEPVRLTAEPVVRGGVGALRVHVRVDDRPATRTWSDVRALLVRADLAEPVRQTALEVFARLAAAEGAVHRVAAEQVHFHEVGALDAVADVVGAAAGLHALGLTGCTRAGSRSAPARPAGRTGRCPCPPPRCWPCWPGSRSRPGRSPHESTPDRCGAAGRRGRRLGAAAPAGPGRAGIGAGGRDPAGVANVAPPRRRRARPRRPAPDALLVEANVDDLDPRLWPGVLTALLAAGAPDAWLTPVLMKKGRPAHMLSALCPPGAGARRPAGRLRADSTIGAAGARCAHGRWTGAWTVTVRRPRCG